MIPLVAAYLPKCRFCFIILKQCRFAFVSFFLVNSRNPILGTQRYCSTLAFKTMQILLHDFKTMQIKIHNFLPCKLQEHDFRYTTIPWHSKQCRFSFVRFFPVNPRNPILGTQRYLGIENNADSAS